jgi:nifR3 family TIM-barrel protein
VDEVCHGCDSAWQQLRYAEIERPIVAQIYGADPDKFYQVAQVLCELGFDGVDINMGCPSKKVSARGCGAALIKNPSLALEIIRAVRNGVDDWTAGRPIEAIGLRPKVADKVMALSVAKCTPRKSIPVSVKTRLGYDSVVIEDWVTTLLKERPEVISIHGRTLAQMYRGSADWGAIARAAKLVRETSTLVMGNGDVESLDGLVLKVRQTHVHGVLIGRGALGNPWIFQEKHLAKEQTYLSVASISLSKVLLEERFRVALEHARYFEAIGGASRFASMRKHLGWYCKGFFKAAEVRSEMFRATSSLDVERILAQVGAYASPLP